MNPAIASIAQLVRAAAVAAAVFVFISLSAFVYDEVKSGSETSQAAINSDVRVEKDPGKINIPDPDPALEKLREREHSDAREFVDDVNDALVSPFKGLIDDSDSIWQQRLVTGLLGLFIYGGLILLIANYLPKKRARRVSSVYEVPPDFRKR